MKTLYLLRHAKSSWEDGNLSDFDRPLNERGLRDAPIMGEILKNKIEQPELIISSSAKRAITTAEIIANSFNYEINKIIKEEKIYHSVVSDLMRIIYETPNTIERLMLFGHNPTFTLVVNYLSDKYIDNLPTCGFVQINFDLKSWEELESNTGKLILFEYPKKYLNKRL
ncbi:MAG: histidine phosphatase family protein [Ignavibacteriales bacterium]|nr:histidine phosphatase family protein [Ignavibacteriales bacterium]